VNANTCMPRRCSGQNGISQVAISCMLTTGAEMPGVASDAHPPPSVKLRLCCCTTPRCQQGMAKHELLDACLVGVCDAAASARPGQELHTQGQRVSATGCDGVIVIVHKAAPSSSLCPARAAAARSFVTHSHLALRKRDSCLPPIVARIVTRTAIKPLPSATAHRHCHRCGIH
jgi:hypothetical protein